MTRRECKDFIKRVDLTQYANSMSISEFCDRAGISLTQKQYDYLKEGSDYYKCTMGLVYIILLDKLLGTKALK